MSSENETNEDFADNPEVLELQKKIPGMSKDIMKKTTDSIRTEIAQISSTIKQLKKKREEHNSQARHYRSMRDNVSDDAGKKGELGSIDLPLFLYWEKT